MLKCYIKLCIDAKIYHFEEEKKSRFYHLSGVIVAVVIVGWLGFTALQHNIGYIAPVSVVSVRMSAHAGLPPCILERWVNSFPPIPLRVCAEFDGGKPFYTPGQ